MKSTPQFVKWWGQINQWRQSVRQKRQAILLRDAEHDLWMEKPNGYLEKDLGYQTICGQRVPAKRVYDTAGVNFVILGDEFKVGKGA